MGAIESKLMTDKKAAMLAKDVVKKKTIIAINAAFTQIRVDEKLESLDDKTEVAVLKRMIKQRKESVSQFEKANRQDLADNEAAEIKVLVAYLPQQMSEDAMKDEVEKVLSEFDNPTMQNIGQIMGKLTHLRETADMGKISQLVRSQLNQG